MSKASTTSDDILACTRKLIVAGGYNGFSYADISEIVGIRKPSIHHHFPSKVDLVQTLVARYTEAAQEGIAALEGSVSDPLGLLRAYIGYWATCIEDDSAPFCICALLAGEMPILPEPVALEVRAYFRFLSQWLVSVFERAAQAGEVTLRRSAALEAEVFMATVHGAMLSARATGNVQVFGAVLNSHLEQLTAKRQ